MPSCCHGIDKALQTIDLFQRRKDFFFHPRIKLRIRRLCLQKYRHMENSLPVILISHDAGILGRASTTDGDRPGYKEKECLSWAGPRAAKNAAISHR